MHDRMFANEIKNTVEKKMAELKKGSRVTAVAVRLSPLSHVNAQTLREAFNSMVEGTQFQQVSLDVRNIEIEAACRACGHVVFITKPLLSCPKCKSEDIQIKQGPEFFVESVEVETD